jgi:hypothetical protein
MECKFSQGVVAACAITLQNHSETTIVRETLECLGPAGRKLEKIT